MKQVRWKGKKEFERLLNRIWYRRSEGFLNNQEAATEIVEAIKTLPTDIQQQIRDTWKF